MSELVPVARVSAGAHGARPRRGFAGMAPRPARHVALAGLLLWVGVARAQPAAPEGSAGAEAEGRYRQGIAEFEAGHWREAVELFKQADALAPSQWLSFNIAKIFERMRDSRSALAWYRDYVRRCRDEAPLPDVLGRIAELEAELAAQGVQQLSVLSTPPGATVLLDGASRGVTPYTGELAPGAHVLELRLRDHHDTWRELSLPAEHAIDVDVTLVPTEGDTPADGTRSATRLVPEPALERAAPGSPPALPERFAPEPVPTASWWTWGLFGGSAALLLGSGAVELSRRGLEGEARDTTTQVDYARRYAEVESRRDTARVLAGLGALLGVAGGVSLYFDLREPGPDGATVGLGCALESCGLLARRAW
jgi:tetratricopeptide (TPR) repeat protein